MMLLLSLPSDAVSALRCLPSDAVSASQELQLNKLYAVGVLGRCTSHPPRLVHSIMCSGIASIACKQCMRQSTYCRALVRSPHLLVFGLRCLGYETAQAHD